MSPAAGKMHITVHHSIIPHPFVPPWRHPVWWWKMRHFRKDIRALEADIHPEVRKCFDEMQNDVFLNGTGR